MRWRKKHNTQTKQAMKNSENVALGTLYTTLLRQVTLCVPCFLLPLS